MVCLASHKLAKTAALVSLSDQPCYLRLSFRCYFGQMVLHCSVWHHWPPQEEEEEEEEEGKWLWGTVGVWRLLLLSCAAGPASAVVLHIALARPTGAVFATQQ